MTFWKPLLLKLFALLTCLTGVSLGVAGDIPYQPQMNTVKPWRVIYYEGGYSSSYYQYLLGLTQGLMRLGWIKQEPIPAFDIEDSQHLWQWLSGTVDSDYLTFLSDGFYSSGWNSDDRSRNKRDILNRLNFNNDVDLVIAMGTWAGQDLANSRHQTPTVVMSTSDPIGSGIINSVNYSGYQHVHARVDPGRYERQLQTFYEAVHFKKLGVAYENSINGRSYAAIDTVKKVAKEHGVEVVECYTQSDTNDQRRVNLSVIHCFEALADEVDSIYVTAQGGVNMQTIPRLVKIASDHRIATFSQAGEQEVAYGFLLSLSRPGYQPVGDFIAKTMGQIMNGAQPGELTQLFEDKENIVINVKAAHNIGLYLHTDIIAAADKIYTEITVPGSRQLP